MYSGDISVRIVSSRHEEARSLVHGLLGLGFSASLNPPRADCPSCGRDRDIIVVIGACNENGRRAFPSFCQLHGDRVIVFLDDMRPDDFALLEKAGVKFINAAKSVTVENIIYLISKIDPELVYGVTKARLLAAEKSKIIETGSLRFFNDLRRGGIRSALSSASEQRSEIGALVSMSPMSVWLDLFQNYHDGTAQHCSLVSSFALLFAKSLGFGLNDIDRIYDAAFFHDVGKAMVPLDVLDKPGRLDDEEWKVMQRHVLHGHDILMRDEVTAGEIARVARDHHEYLDGSGYPNGIGAARIDDPTRILTICDIFAALVEKRAYKAPKRPDEAFDIIRSMAGSKLDPDLVRLFERVVDEYDGAARRIGPGESTG